MSFDSDNFRKMLANRIYPKPNNSSTGGGFFLTALIAGAVGAVTALFTAPGSGKQNREAFRKYAQARLDEMKDIEDKAETKFGEIKDEFDTKTKDFRTKVNQQLEQVKDTVGSGIDRLRSSSVVDELVTKPKRKKAKTAKKTPKDTPVQ